MRNREAYERIRAFTAKKEGGLSIGQTDDPDTNFGISQPTYDGFRTAHGRPIRSVTEIDAHEESEFYEWWWVVNQCDDLPSPMAELHFDMTFNHGTVNGVKILQQAMTDLVVDGAFGPKTRAKAKIFFPGGVFAPQRFAVASEMCWLRIEFYTLIRSKFPKYGRGWIIRGAELRRFLRIP